MLREIQWYKVFDDWDMAERAIPLNTMRKADINGRKICILHYNDRFIAVDDMCPHQRASLSQGKLNGYGEIICPLHHYRFDLRTGQETEDRCKYLEVHQMEERDGEIFIGIAPSLF